MEFTGDINQWIKCRNHLQNKGYSVSDAIHIGNNKFEFEETLNLDRLGCYDYYKILAHIEKDKVVYRKVKIGSICVD